MLLTDRHICTSTCIDYYKVCEIHHVFQREYITKFISHLPVQFNYVKIMKYHYLYSYLYYTPICITGMRCPKKARYEGTLTDWPHDDLEMVVVVLVKYKY